MTASQISPSGMTLAGKHGIGVISIGSLSTEGLTALPTQWGFAEDAAKKHGKTVSRKDWRVLLSWHIAETREKAQREAGKGLMRWHNEYIVGTLQRPGASRSTRPMTRSRRPPAAGSAATIGTPDDLVKTIKNVIEMSGGLGTIVGFAHDWANLENTFRSWDMVARYVIPEINGYISGLRRSQKHVIENRELFERAGQAVMAKIMENDKAAAALAVHAPAASRSRQQRAGPGEGSGQAQGVIVFRKRIRRALPSGVNQQALRQRAAISRFTICHRRKLKPQITAGADRTDRGAGTHHYVRAIWLPRNLGLILGGKAYWFLPPRYSGRDKAADTMDNIRNDRDTTGAIAMSMQSVASPAISLPPKRKTLRHIPGNEGWPLIGNTLEALADPKGRSSGRRPNTG